MLTRLKSGRWYCAECNISFPAEPAAKAICPQCGSAASPNGNDTREGMSGSAPACSHTTAGSATPPPTAVDPLSALADMSKHLKQQGIASIVCGALNGVLLLEGVERDGRSTDNMTFVENLILMFFTVLIVEGVVLLFRRRPKMLLYDAVVFFIVGILNVVFNDPRGQPGTFLVALGIAQMGLGVRSIVYYFKVIGPWKAALAALDTGAGDRAYVLDRQLRGIATESTEHAPWQQTQSKQETGQERPHAEDLPVCARCGLRATPVPYFNHWKGILWLCLLGILYVYPGYVFWKRNSKRFVCRRCGHAFTFG